MYSFLGSREDMRAMVVDVLSADWPLDKRGIYARIRKEDGKAAKSQVVAAIRKLEDAGVLIEANRRFAISLGWLEETKKKAKGMALPKDREKLDLSRLKKQNDSFSLTFDSFAESLYALLAAAREDYENPENQEPLISHWFRACPSIAIAREHFAPMKKFLKMRAHYVLCRGDAYLDRLLLEFWQEFGSNVRYGVNCAAGGTNKVVTEDRIIQIFLPSSLQKSLDAVYNCAKPSSLNLGALYKDVFSWHEPVTVIATKNRLLADQIREETLKYFK